MRAILLCLAIAPLLCSAVSSTSVRGHVRKDGVYVPPHHRTTPNDTKRDNYSSKPNTNPYTGKEGTVDPYAPKLPTKPR